MLAQDERTAAILLITLRTIHFVRQLLFSENIHHEATEQFYGGRLLSDRKTLA